MESNAPGQYTCNNCGSPLQSEHRFCPNCGTATNRELDADSHDPVDEPFPAESPTPEPHPVHSTTEPDPSILETRQHETHMYTASEHSPQGPAIPPPDPTYQDSEHPTWGTPETVVPPERGNRTLWIILGIIAFIVLLCCCVLPLTLMAISSFDTAFQEDLSSTIARMSL